MGKRNGNPRLQLLCHVRFVQLFPVFYVCVRVHTTCLRFHLSVIFRQPNEGSRSQRRVFLRWWSFPKMLLSLILRLYSDTCHTYGLTSRSCNDSDQWGEDRLSATGVFLIDAVRLRCQPNWGWDGLLPRLVTAPKSFCVHQNWRLSKIFALIYLCARMYLWSCSMGRFFFYERTY